MKEITVIDSIMGSGKTSWAKQYMLKEKGEKRFLYITPFLNEIENNILVDCPFLKEPDSQKGKGSKLKHFKELLAQGESIITTHALFKLFDSEVIELLKDAGYILILDEVANVIERLEPVTGHDISMLIETGKVKVEHRQIKWLDDTYNGLFDSKGINLKYHAEQGNIYTYGGNVLIWTFPAKVFELFEETYILTYLFDGQIQKYYYDLFDIKYTYKSIDNIGGAYCLVEYNDYQEERANYKELINVFDGNLNHNYVVNGKVRGNELSSTWLNNASEDVLKQLKGNLYTYFRRHCKAKSKDIIWTTKKDKQSVLKGKGYTKGFLPFTTRATNDYQEVHNLAFVYNRYMNPIEKGFFTEAGIQVNEKLLALSDLLQWIWRSAIRKEEPEEINVYIPSVRMRRLLEGWLNGEEVKKSSNIKD